MDHSNNQQEERTETTTTDPNNKQTMDITIEDNTESIPVANMQQMTEQLSLENEAQMEQEDRNRCKGTTWGDNLPPKAPMSICLLLQNIGGIDKPETRSIKLVVLRNYINKTQTDICAITECNTDWKHAPAHPTQPNRQCTGERVAIGVSQISLRKPTKLPTNQAAQH